MDGPHRHDKAQPVSGSDIAATPPSRQIKAVLGRHEASIRLGQGLGAQVVLSSPAQARPPERWPIRTHQRFQAGIAGLGQQDGAQRRRQVLRPGLRFADMSERAGKPASRIDL
jgi:hypothetical protein